MKNKLIRLVELIQEDYPEDIMALFRTEEQVSLDDKLTLTGRAISHHQKRSAELWLAAGRKRTLAEKHAAARADLAAFLLAYLTGDAKENVSTALEALDALGRQSETDLVKSLARRR